MINKDANYYRRENEFFAKLGARRAEQEKREVDALAAHIAHTVGMMAKGKTGGTMFFCHRGVKITIKKEA